MLCIAGTFDCTSLCDVTSKHRGVNHVRVSLVTFQEVDLRSFLKGKKTSSLEEQLCNSTVTRVKLQLIKHYYGKELLDYEKECEGGSCLPSFLKPNFHQYVSKEIRGVSTCCLMTIDLGVNLGHFVHLASSFLLLTEFFKWDNTSYFCSYSIVVKNSFHVRYQFFPWLSGFYWVLLFQWQHECDISIALSFSGEQSDKILIFTLSSLKFRFPSTDLMCQTIGLHFCDLCWWTLWLIEWCTSPLTSYTDI